MKKNKNIRNIENHYNPYEFNKLCFKILTLFVTNYPSL